MWKQLFKIGLSEANTQARTSNDVKAFKLSTVCFKYNLAYTNSFQKAHEKCVHSTKTMHGLQN